MGQWDTINNNRKRVEDEFVKLRARDCFGRAKDEDFIAWAGKALEAGLDTKSLRILAGLNLPRERDEIEPYFRKAVAELELKWPSWEEATYSHLREIAEAILSRQITPSEGCSTIYCLSADLGHPQALRNWIYLDDQLSLTDYRNLTEAELEAEVQREAESIIQNADQVIASIRQENGDSEIRSVITTHQPTTDKAKRIGEVLLRAVNLTKIYRGRVEEVVVFRDLQLEVAQGEMVAIVGASGAGKSTLLHLLGGLDQPTSGSVILGEFDSAKIAEVDWARFRNRAVGFVFQFHHLLPEFSALENVMMPRLIGGAAKREAAAQAERLLQRVGLAQRAAHRPGELSGGERQRIAVARALVNAPQLLLADEPTGNLDERTGEALHALLRQLQQEDGLTAVIATHNMHLAAQCDRVLRLENGRLEEVPGSTF
jgi:lipoprotein-releasing system ATP-binding protein